MRRGEGQAAGGARRASSFLASAPQAPGPAAPAGSRGAAARPLQVTLPSSISPWQCFLRGVCKGGSVCISARSPLVPLRCMPVVAPRVGCSPAGSTAGTGRSCFATCPVLLCRQGSGRAALRWEGDACFACGRVGENEVFFSAPCRF